MQKMVYWLCRFICIGVGECSSSCNSNLILFWFFYLIFRWSVQWLLLMTSLTFWRCLRPSILCIRNIVKWREDKDLKVVLAKAVAVTASSLLKTSIPWNFIDQLMAIIVKKYYSCLWILIANNRYNVRGRSCGKLL